MASKSKEYGSVKEKKPSFPLRPQPINSIPRRRSLGPTAIPIPSSPDNHRQIPNYLKPVKSLNTDPTSKNHSKKLTSTTTTTDTTHKLALARRRSFDKPPSPSQLPKPLTTLNPREKNLQSSSSFKARTTTSNIQRPVTKEKLSKQSSTLPKQGPERLLSKTTLTSPKLGQERSPKPSTKDIEKPHSLKNLSKNVRKTTYSTNTTTSPVKPKNTASTHGCVRKPRNTSTITTNDESSLRGDDPKLKTELQDQDSYIVESRKETIHVGELPIEILILEDKGDSNLILDDHFLNQQGDKQINPTLSNYQNAPPMLEMEESQEPESREVHFSEAKYMDEQGRHISSIKSMDSENMCHQQETIPKEDKKGEKKKELESEETQTNENVKDEMVEDKGTLVDEGIQNDAQHSKGQEEVKPEKENLNLLSNRQGKKDSPAYNDVIEETASRLREQRKNKVRALVGAFETVILLEDPMGENSLPK